MKYNKDKVDEITLALLWLNIRDKRYAFQTINNIEKKTLRRLKKEGYIEKSIDKAKAIFVTSKGKKLAEKLFLKHFM